MERETAYAMAGKAFIRAYRCEKHCYPANLILCKEAKWAVEQILVVKVKEDLIDFIIRKKILVDPEAYWILNRYVQTRRSTY